MLIALSGSDQQTAILLEGAASLVMCVSDSIVYGKFAYKDCRDEY